MANEDIRQAIKDAGLKHWELANIMKISENTLVRRLREELSKKDKEKILETIHINNKK